MTTQEMTAKDQRFVAEYLACLDPTKAALAAGFAATTARTKAYMWVSSRKTKPAVFDAIRAGFEKRTSKLERTADGVVANLWRQAHLDPRKVAKWGVREMIEEVTEGKKKTKRRISVPYMDIVSSEDMDDDTALAITGVKMGANGIELKFADKHAATATLGRHFGIFEKDRADTNVHVTFQIDGAGSPAYEAG